MKFKFYLAAALLLMLLIFILQNTEVVNLNFLVWHLSLSRALLLLLVFAMGLFLGMLFGSAKRLPGKTPPKPNR